MSEQKGIIKISGTIGGTTYYKRNGKYYYRRKTSLSKAQVLKDSAFARSRRSSSIFGTAAKIAKEVYSKLPSLSKGHGVMGSLTGQANRLLHEGMEEADVLDILLKQVDTPIK